MSTYKMFFAGSGGQGIMLVGQMVAQAAMLEDMSATYFPSYGTEMRGGTANCTVVVSDKPVSCPLIFESDFVVAMNLPSLLKFEQTLKPGGIMLLNKSMINQKAKRSDITVVEVPANELAIELGNSRVANVVMLGAFVRATKIVAENTMEKVLHETIGAKKAELHGINMKAFALFKQ